MGVANVINPMVFGGSTFPLVFADGTVMNIPMSKVHINKDGVTSIPANCYPILVRIDYTLVSGGGWGYTSIYYGKNDINTLSSSAHNENNIQGSGCSGSAYVPFCCTDYDDLLNGKFRYVANRTIKYNEIKYIVWAEKTGGVISRLLKHLARKWGVCDE